MPGRCLTCQLYCAGARILCYQFCCCCFHEKRAKKKDVNVLVLGLENAGKSHLLATLCGESTNDIQPTNGFSLKDISLERTIMHVKEVGGSDKIRPYWKHYMNNSQGVVFVVDGSDISYDKLEDIKNVMYNAMTDTQLVNKPLLVLVTKVDSTRDSSVEEFVSRLNLASISKEFIVDYAYDVEYTKGVLQKLSHLICKQSDDNQIGNRI